MSIRVRNSGILLAVCLTFITIAAAAEDLARNGNCEEVVDGKPVSWDVYGSPKEWGSVPDGYREKAVYFVPPDFQQRTEGPNKGRNYTSAALVQGDANGYSGPNALVHVPDTSEKYYRYPSAVSYKVSFWYRSVAAPVRMYLRGWRTREAGPGDRVDGSGGIAGIPATDEWTHYEATVTPNPETKTFCIMFLVDGYEDEGLKLGPVYVDELKIEKVAGLTADSLRRVEIPPDPAVFVGDTPLEDILAAYRGGDAAAISQVKATLAGANEYAAKPDEWYRQFFANFEPRGHYTITCPIHPFQTRFYMDFKCSLDEPWKLVCQHCKDEGRKYCYYPNPDYPDDGQGCAPTDEAWARTHDAAWSKNHRGIPHDHWDGLTHGDVEGRRFYFLGKYYVLALGQLEGSVAPTLGLAYHYATKLFPEDSEEYKQARLYAHKAHVILLCSARAHFGDDYLAAAEGMTPEQFQKRLADFFWPPDGGKWQYRKLHGFRPFNGTDDATLGDPVYDDITSRRPTGYKFFDGSWAKLGGTAGYMLEAFCRSRASFTENDDDIRRMCQRLVVSLPGDQEKVALGQDPPAHFLKRGVFEMEIHPYSLQTGGDNQPNSSQVPRLRAGLMLRDDSIVENVARDIMYFWRNYFSQDGLGHEGSPSYSAYGITSIMEQLQGMTGGFDRNAPYFDKAAGSINMFRMPVYQWCALKMPYYATTEDDLYIPWEDSNYYAASRNTVQLRFIEKYGGGIPEEERKYYNIERQQGGEVAISFNRNVPLPPMLLHDRRKAILRGGQVAKQTVACLDFTKKTGHYHPPAQTLMVHACGQELASDLGYLSSGHFLTINWIQTFPAHNCLTLRKVNGDPNGTREIRGDLRRNFICSPTCQVADTAEYDQADWARFGETQNGEFSRQVLLMLPSEEHQYVIDIARGRGGDIHDYYFHSHGLSFEADGINLKSLADPETNLYDHSGWTFRCAEGFGAKNIKQLATGTSTGSWRAVWSRIDDYRGQPAQQPLIHEDVFMRLWMADEPGSQVFVGDAPAQRDFRNLDLNRRMKVLCVRRLNTPRIDKFVAVIEPYEKEAFVRSVRRLDLHTDDDYVVGLAVDTIHGTDYVIAYGGPDTPPVVQVQDSGHTIATDTDLAVVSFPRDGKASLLLAGGSYLKADKFELELKGAPALTGRLLDFDDTADTMLIEAGASSPDGWETVKGEVLAGQTLIVQHREDRSSFTIRSVEALGGGRYLLRLDGHPHLMNNWLLVRHVDGSGITVEPPPVLDHKRSAFKVYAGDPASPHMLGPLRQLQSVPVCDEWGTAMQRFYQVVTDDYTGVEPGGEIGITRLEKGHDTVFVTRFAYETYGSG